MFSMRIGTGTPPSKSLFEFVPKQNYDFVNVVYIYNSGYCSG